MNGPRLISAADYFSAAEEALAAGHDAAFTVTGSSMLPFLGNRRDRVVISSCEVGELRRGDIVVVRVDDETYLLHRIIRITQRGIETRGDWNLHKDGCFAPEQVIARVTRVLRRGRDIDARGFFWRAAGSVWNALFFARRPLIKLSLRLSHTGRREP